MFAPAERLRRLMPRRQPVPPPRRSRMMLSVAGISTATGALCAGMMYLFDPQLGRRRRKMARDRSEATARRMMRRVEHWTRRARSDARGLVQRARHYHHHDEVAPNDETLADRVRSEILRNREPRPRINVNVEHGVVVLRGQLEHEEEIRSLTNAARRVAGVKEVHSFLHLPSEPPPNLQPLYNGAASA